MKIPLIYLSAFALCFFSLGMIKISTITPEQTILGDWDEIAWEVERVEKSVKDKLPAIDAPKYAKHIMGQHLVIHEAEHWTFQPDGILTLKGDCWEQCATWNIKGRGHVLQIKYEDGNIENYNITTLEDGRMVLNFDTDVHARGIARLEFTKTGKLSADASPIETQAPEKRQEP